MKQFLEIQKAFFVFVIVASGFVCVNKSESFVYPIGNAYKLTYEVSQGFNNSYDDGHTVENDQGIHVRYYGHLGVDFRNGQSGGEVKSIADGIVVFSGFNSGFGYMVRIKHILPYKNEIVYSQYGHMLSSSLTVSNEDRVNVGQKIGEVGNTGFSTGAHLDFQVKTINKNGPGYTYGDDSLLEGYLDPLAFIKIGHFFDGWHSSSSEAFINRYELKLGVPNDNRGGIYVHEWPKPEDRNTGKPYVIIQDYLSEDKNNRYGTDGQTALIYNPAADKAYLLKEGFWGLYKPDKFVMPGGHNTLIDFFGPHHLGAPRSDEHFYSGNENIIVQEFELGYLYYYKQADLFRIKFKTDHAPSGSNLFIAFFMFL